MRASLFFRYVWRCRSIALCTILTWPPTNHLKKGRWESSNDTIPLLVPLQFFSLCGPKCLRVRRALCGQRVPILQPRLIRDLLGRIQHFALHAACLSGTCHARISSTGMQFRAILIGIIRFSHDKTGCEEPRAPSRRMRRAESMEGRDAVFPGCGRALWAAVPKRIAVDAPSGRENSPYLAGRGYGSGSGARCLARSPGSAVQPAAYAHAALPATGPAHLQATGRRRAGDAAHSSTPGQRSPWMLRPQTK